MNDLRTRNEVLLRALEGLNIPPNSISDAEVQDIFMRVHERMRCSIRGHPSQQELKTLPHSHQRLANDMQEQREDFDDDAYHPRGNASKTQKRRDPATQRGALDLKHNNAGAVNQSNTTTHARRVHTKPRQGTFDMRRASRAPRLTRTALPNEAHPEPGGTVNEECLSESWQPVYSTASVLENRATGASSPFEPEERACDMVSATNRRRTPRWGSARVSSSHPHPPDARTHGPLQTQKQPFSTAGTMFEDALHPTHDEVDLNASRLPVPLHHDPHHHIKMISAPRNANPSCPRVHDRFRKTDVVNRGECIRAKWKADPFLSQNGRKELRWEVRCSML